MATTTGDSEFEELELPPTSGGDESLDMTDAVPVPKALNRWKKLAKEGVVIPFSSVHDEPNNFKVPNRKCFMPGKPMEVDIIGVERTGSTHFLNANLYVIQLKHGDHTWIVKRRYKHFQHLHQQLMLYRVTLSVPFPSRSHKERRTTYKTSIDGEQGRPKGLPRFPKRPEALVASDHLEERKEALQEYLRNLLQIRAFRNHHETLDFLEVSHLSFIHGLGLKGKESLVLKRAGTTERKRCGWCCNCPCFRFQNMCGVWCGQWQRRWLIAKDTWIAYVRPKDGRLHCVMLFDNDFEVSSQSYDVEHGVIISNLSRRLVVKCWTKRKSKEWIEHIRKLMTTEVAKGFIGENRFGSFAPIRQNVKATWFVDGSSYMAAVADAMEAATEEIFIADWWLSPEIYMKRPILEGERWRLDKIIQRKAKQGVKVFVLLYKEVSMALGINSYYSKQTLISQESHNIKVLRHPDHASAGILLWAHHEKLVIIDQTYAFVGGIDLCLGRWDDHKHRLTDLGSVSTSSNQTGRLKITSSQPTGMMNSSLLQLAKATNMVTMGTLVDQAKMTLPATIEITEAVEANGSAAKAEAKSPAASETKATVTFAEAAEIVEDGTDDGGLEGELKDEDGQVKPPLKGETPPSGRRAKLMRRMTSATKGLKSEGKELFERLRIRKGDSESSSDSEGEGKDKEGKEKRRHFRMIRRKKHSTTKEGEADGTASEPEPEAKKPGENDAMNGLQGSSKLWMGKDYTNFIVKDFADIDSPFTDLVDRSTTPRMPWHDIACFIQGTPARDVARHFIQRWNAVKEEKVRLNNSYPYLLPKSYDINNDTIPPLFPNPGRLLSNKVNCQVIRSVSKWNCGIETTEDSIHQAYLDAIQNAQYYVYMENQFFISLAQFTPYVQNRIGEALLNRILQAHREKKPFRVFITIPLLPGFEGEVGTSRGVAIHAIAHWEFASICRGPDSLYERLKNNGIEDPTEYLSFHGLRTWSELHGDLVTELIYVHSKLLIADDNLVICGSANINDRSMLGKRDSEVGVVLQDEEFVPSVMNGKEYKAGKNAFSLRMRLFREHLGYLNESNVDEIKDPIAEHFYRNIWQKTAQKNTDIYDEVFHVMPNDKCETFAQLQVYQAQHDLAARDPARARQMLRDVKGYLVQLPLKFLGQEDLSPPSATMEGMMPTELWT